MSKLTFSSANTSGASLAVHSFLRLNGLSNRGRKKFNLFKNDMVQI